MAATIVSALPSLRAGVSNASDVGSTSGEYTHRAAVSGAGFGASRAARAASLTSASTEASVALNSASVAVPRARRNSANRLIGSRFCSSSRSAGVLYSFSLSENECE